VYLIELFTLSIICFVCVGHFCYAFLVFYAILHLLRSNRRHLSCGDCLEDKREDYENCSVLYCIPQLYTVISTHIYEQLLQMY